MNRSFLLYLVILLSGYSASTAAEDTDEAAMANAQISLSQAVSTAEEVLQGKAVKAEIEVENGKTLYEVDVLKGGKKFEAKVDALTGKVITTKED